MRIILILITISFVIACKKKNNAAETPFVWPAGTGEYAPYTTGSKFTYEVTTTTPATVDSFTYTVTKDTVIDGLTCKKLESNKPVLANTIYVNYGNGVRTEYTFNTTFQSISVPVVKQEVLKDATPVNGTWNNVLNVNVPAMPPTLPIPLTVPITFAYTMKQRDITKNILSKDYANTFQVQLVASLPSNLTGFLPAGTPSSVTTDSYFSKGVGLSQRDLATGATKIKSFNVVK